MSGTVRGLMAVAAAMTMMLTSGAGWAHAALMPHTHPSATSSQGAAPWLVLAGLVAVVLGVLSLARYLCRRGRRVDARDAAREAHKTIEARAPRAH